MSALLELEEAVSPLMGWRLVKEEDEDVVEAELDTEPKMRLHRSGAHKALADVELLFMNDRKRLLEAEPIPGKDDRQQGTWSRIDLVDKALILSERPGSGFEALLLEENTIKQH